MYRPFEVLVDLVREGRIRLVEAPRSGAGPVPAEILDPADDLPDEELFELAMDDVEPLGWSAAEPPASPPLDIRAGGGEAEALALLEEFSREDRVGFEHSREYDEHSVHPAGRLYLGDLREGRFAIQAHLDLHGMTLDRARSAVEVFFRESIRAGFRCVRVVHGRGRHSPDRQPVMKESLQKWMRQRRLGRYVIAFTTARQFDGGGGAIYVLLGEK